MATVDLQSTNESGMLYYDHEQIKGQLDGLDTSNSINDKLNGITNEVNRKGVIHRKVYESAAEVTRTGSTAWYDTAKTFDIVAPVNALILGINFIATLKNDNNSGLTDLGLKISGTNLGALYCASDNIFLRTTATGSVYSLATTINSTQGATFRSYGNTYKIFSVNLNKPIKLLDTTTTFTVQMRPSSGSDTAYVKDVVIEVIYVENFEEDA